MKSPEYHFIKKNADANIKLFKQLISAGAKVFYAVKSNNYPYLVDKLAQNGFSFDVATKEEIQYVIDHGANAKELTFAAPSKRFEDIKFAHSLQIRTLMFDSPAEVEKILAEYDPLEVDLVLRLESKGARAVFNLSDKFGVTFSEAKDLLEIAATKKWPVKGVTFHVGSQNTDLDAWDNTLVHALEVMAYGKKLGLDMNIIDIGGGVPVPYADNHLPTEVYVKRLIGLIKDLKTKYPDYTVAVEPGRAISANTMELYTTVIDIKPWKEPPILIVDTGVFNGIIEPLEHLEYPMELSRKSSKRKKSYRVAGFTCEGYDILAHDIKLPSDVKVGDILKISMAGAYTFVYKNFHMVDYPPIVEI